MSLNLNQCDGACLECVKAYKCKHSLKSGQKFNIKCKGIASESVQLSLLSQLPTNEQQIAKAMIDPVVWAAETLDWHCLDPDGSIWKRKNPEEYEEWRRENPGVNIYGKSRYHRPYQAEMLRCSARRKVFRVGRQAGKCLPSGTLIQMADGTQKPIELINDNDLVVSLDDNYKSVINPALRACNGEKEVLRIELMDGREIEATYNHPFLSRKNVGRETTGHRRAIFKDEWIEADQLSVDDYLAVPRNIILDRYEGISDYYMTILGCMIADGNITGGNCRFSNENPIILKHFSNAIKYLGCSLKQYESDQSKCDYHLIGEGIGKKHKIKSWLRDIGLQGLDAHQKHIPDFFMSLMDENIVELLRCMFGCDGWASVSADNSVEIGYSTVSEKLATQIVALLARFGIYTDIRHKTIILNGKKFYSRQLCITRKESIANFRNKIGILGKEESVEEVYRISQMKESSPKTEAYEDNDITFIKIRSIVRVGKKMTWDLTVPKTHNFIANNIVTHNTECIVVSMLYHMFTKPGIPDTEGFEIVVITPYQSQIDLIFNRMLQLIRSSPVTNNSLRRNVKAPIYQIQLHNESVAKGFTAGTKSGGNADAVRGQHAHMLVFDEADYLSAGDMDSALSIITNYPSASMWMSSTPSGKREKFYQTCFSPLFKEFYYSSQVNPMWNSQLEALFKEQLTEIGYKHEVLGEFGEQEEGVFQNVYVQAAKMNYKYGDHQYFNTWTYSIGVDWNDTKNGTTIVVVGFNPTVNKFIVVDRQIVSRDGWTQTLACERIAELNRLWRPAFIYLDAGHGGTQWEMLRKFGFDSVIDPTKGPNHPDAHLRDVKKYDFGSKIEVHDLFTHQPIQKDAKPFLVENTVRRFEAQDIKISGHDEMLERQLLGYIIDRITPTGRPVYKAGDETAGDHLLDALMLAMIGFTLEVSPLGKPKYSSRIQIAGRFGEGAMPEIYPGDTVIHPQKKQKEIGKQLREKVRPTMNRTTNVGEEQLTLFGSKSDLPAYNTNNKRGPVKPWAHPGFLRDEPAPRVRTLGEASDDARSRLGIRRRIAGMPRRKNI